MKHNEGAEAPFCSVEVGSFIHNTMRTSVRAPLLIADAHLE